MDCRNRKGSIVIEMLLLALFFTSMILIYEFKAQRHILKPNKFRWEKTHD